jgi:hypothetical protein
MNRADQYRSARSIQRFSDWSTTNALVGAKHLWSIQSKSAVSEQVSGKNTQIVALMLRPYILIYTIKMLLLTVCPKSVNLS